MMGVLINDKSYVYSVFCLYFGLLLSILENSEANAFKNMKCVSEVFDNWPNNSFGNTYTILVNLVDIRG